jgi:hypothetical protein
MRRVMQLLTCVALAAIARGQQSQPNSPARYAADSVFVERLKTIASQAGGRVIECGIESANQNETAEVGACGPRAFQDHNPFFLGHETAFRGFAYGLAGDAAGNVFQVIYDSRGYPPVAPNGRMRLMDDNHTRVTECVKPVTLEKDREGLLTCVAPVNGEKSELAAHQSPINTTVCAVLENPAAFNNKMVRVRGHYSHTFETSKLGGDECGGSLWFTYGGADSSPAGVGVLGFAHRVHALGSEDSEGKLILPVPVKLIRDSKLEQFEALAKDAMGGSHATATFVGRIDAVSDDVHNFLREHPTDHGRTWWLGFGHMGGFEAQLVVQSVEDYATAH